MTFCGELNVARFAVCTTVGLMLLCICCTGAAGHFANKPTGWKEDYGFEIGGVPEKREALPRAIHDNGMLHLVLHYLSLKLIKEMEAEEETALSKRQGEVLHEKITDFYDEILKHPALNNNRVAFSQKKPDFAKFRPDHSAEAVFPGRREKRGTSGRLTEICTSVSGWQEERQGVTRTHDVVALFPDQHFYTTRCLSNGQSCNHIDEGTTTSECRSRSSWSIAYVDNGLGGYTWEWIAIDTCCSCAASS